MNETTVFVGRERQLLQLDAFLTEALAGHGQVCFITGDAGAGKTTLAAEFVRRAEARSKDLVVAVGMGDPQTGSSDPYLIFREVLTMLTGDVEARLAQGAISQESAKRLHQTVRTSIDCLLQYGPDLVGLLIPGANLVVQVAKVGIDVSKKAGLMEKLAPASGAPKSGAPVAKGIDQGQIYEQYAKVLKALSEHFPLTLVLDDLQWADDSSIDLLFHLVRRIESSRILIVGLYRPAEIALGRGGEHHPLEKVLTELKRYQGDVFIDLDQAARQEGVAFSNAFLDSEPNRLGPGFRQILYERTGGNPLFVVELLRDMQEQGDIIHDAQGRWTEGGTLDWSKLPARAEGVIEARISRLTGDLLEALKLASVQGDAFTAEVVAQIRDLNVRDFVRQLSSDLEKRHRLVSAQGQQRIGDQRMSQYQFQNRLFQQYLYAALDATERAYFHEDIGRALEGIYGERTDEVAMRLAWHFEQAGIADKACTYLRRSGDQAAARSANAEAVGYFTRALALTPAEDRTDRYVLLLGREKAYHLLGKRDAQAQDLDELDHLAEIMADPHRRAEVALERAYYAEAIHDYPMGAAASEAAITWAESGADAEREINARLQLGWVHYRQGLYPSSLAETEQALDMARQAALKPLEADSLRLVGMTYQTMGSLDLARHNLERSLQLYQELNDRRGEGKAVGNLAINYRNEGRFTEARSWYDRALAIAQEVGDRRTEAHLLNNLGVLSISIGDLDAARSYIEQVLVIVRDIGERMTEGAAQVNLSTILRMQGDHERALAYAEEALAGFQAISSHYGEGHAWTGIGHALVELERLDTAAEAFQQAVTIRSHSNEASLLLESQAGLARVHLLQGDFGRALADLNGVLAHLAEGGMLTGTEEPFLIYLTCYEVLQANDDLRAGETLATAYGRLLEQAAGLPEEEQNKYLANIPQHREIIKAYTGAYPEVSLPQPVTPALSSESQATIEQHTPLPPPAPAPPSVPEPVAAQVAESVAGPPPAGEGRQPVVQETPAVPAGDEIKPISAASPVAALRAAWQDRVRPLAERERQLGLAALLVVAAIAVILALAGLRAILSPASCPPDCAGADLSGQNWRGANLTGSDLEGANLYATRLAGADLTGSNLISATLTTADLNQTSLMAADARRADFVGVNLINADLRGADLSGADLRGAVLVGADLTSANLQDARLIGANLLGATLAGADLSGADLRVAELQANDASLSQVQQNPVARRALSKAAWAAMALSSADLTGVRYDDHTRWPEGFTPPPSTP